MIGFASHQLLGSAVQWSNLTRSRSLEWRNKSIATNIPFLAESNAALRVVNVNLSRAGLAGPVSRMLARLDALQVTNLSENGLAGATHGL